MYKAITGLTTKMGMRLVLVFLLFVSTGLHAETLMRLEAITSRYSTLKAFLQDPAAVTEYRDALKLYMGEDKSFDAVYDEFIRQIKEVQEKVTGFGAQAWAVNLDWQKQGFTISGEHAGSGLEIKREALFSEIEKLKAETKLTATSLIEGTAKTADLIAELKSTYGLLTEAEMGKFSRGQHAAYRKRLLGDEENGVPKISDHPAAKALAAYAVHELLEKDERFSDAFYSQDADITVRTLKKLDRLPELHEAIGDLGVDIPKSILSYLKFTSPASEKIVSEYESGIASMKAFRHIADAKIDLALLTRMQQLQAEGIEAHQIPERLNDVEREKLRDWQVKTQAVRGKKRALADSYNLKNPFFSYQFHEDSARGTLRLKSETPTELHLVASPRPFHAFFAGRKTKECVGGRDCENLAPKRWARAALKGTVNFFTEIGNQKMEGMVALTPLIREVDGKTITYDVLDLMSHALKGDVIVRDEAGRQIKYSMFDEFVDRYRVAAGSAGLIISNGNNVSQNVQGGEVVNYSAAYLENQEVGKPDDFSPLDPMAKEIVRLFPNIYMNYGRGGMVYDGMRGDGTKVVRLVPSRERRKWTKEELEDDLIEALLTKKQISDKDILWKRAKESGVHLESFKYYQSHFDRPDSPLVKRALDNLGKRLLEQPRTESGKRAAGILDIAMKTGTSHPLVMALVADLLAKHPSSQAGVEAVLAFQVGMDNHVKNDSYVTKEILEALTKNMTDYAGSEVAFHSIMALRSALVEYSHLPLVTKPIMDGFLLNLTEHPGADAAAVAANALVSAAGYFPSPHLTSKMLEAAGDYLGKHPDSQAMDIFLSDVENRDLPEEENTIAKRVLTEYALGPATRKIMAALGEFVHRNSRGTPDMDSGLIEAIRQNLEGSLGTRLAADAASVLWGVFDSDENLPLFIKPEMIKTLTLALSDYDHSSIAASGIFSGLMERLPQEKALFQSEVILGIVKSIKKLRDNDTQIRALVNAIKANPATVLLLEDADLQKSIKTIPELRDITVETLLSGKHKKTLFQAMRAGKHRFINNAFAQSLRKSENPRCNKSFKTLR